MGLSHHLLLTFNCVSHSPKRARQWHELFLFSLSTSGLWRLLLVPLQGFTPARGTWSNSKGSGRHPTGHTGELLRLGRALPQLSPSHLSFPQGLVPELHQAPQKYVNSFFFFMLYRCTHASRRAECGRLLVLSRIKL